MSNPASRPRRETAHGDPAAAREAADLRADMRSTQERERLSGMGRVLIAVYIVLALAATFRSAYQILSKFDEAPLAYSLSAISGVVYVIATVALMRRTGAWRPVAWVALGFELLGVLIVGTLSITEPQLFGHDSVWSYFGSGYVFIPLVLPVLGLIWLARTGRAEARERAAGRAAATEPRAENGVDEEDLY